jgi:hypothetical protein
MATLQDRAYHPSHFFILIHSSITETNRLHIGKIAHLH